ncbi:MAG: hypothetical protein V4689_18775 [Verrucomicrobiota bacterium]
MSKIPCIAALLLSASQAFALAPKDLLGNWAGHHEETVNGRGKTFSVVLKGSKISDGAIRLVEHAESPGITATYLFKKDGKFSCKTVQYGMHVLSSYSGSWKSSSGNLIISGSGTDGRLFGAVTETDKGFRFSGNAAKHKIVINARRR